MTCIVSDAEECDCVGKGMEGMLQVLGDAVEGVGERVRESATGMRSPETPPPLPISITT